MYSFPLHTKKTQDGWIIHKGDQYLPGGGGAKKGWQEGFQRDMRKFGK